MARVASLLPTLLLALALSSGAARAAEPAAPAPPFPAPPSSAPLSRTTPQTCTPQPAERTRLLTLEMPAFGGDRDGWTPYAAAHCYSEAAALISDYIAQHARMTLDDEALLRFDAAQMLADANRADDAIAEMRRVLDIEPQRPHPDPGWRLYVQGSAAFLRGDRPALDKASSGLAQYAGMEKGRDRAGDELNLNALHGLQRCFGSSYAYAFGSPDCRDFGEAQRLNAQIG